MRGGVSAVIQTIEASTFWAKYRCDWLECQINAHFLRKIGFLLRALIRSFVLIPRASLVHFHTAPGHSLLVQLPFFLFSLLLKKSIIVQFHVGDQLRGAGDSRLFRFYCRNADTIITLGDQLRSYIPTRNGCPQVEFLYNPAPTVSIKEQSEQYFLFAAYIDSEMNKGYDILLEGFAQTVRQYPDWKLVICGDGDLDKLKKLICHHHLEDKVVLPGWVSGQQKDCYFKHAYAYCLTSRKEGLPITVLESLSMGLPVISTPVGCLPEFLQDSQSVLFFESGNAGQLSSQMCRLISDSALYDRLSSQGILLAKGMLSRTAFLEKLDRIYQSSLYRRNRQTQ